MSKKDMAMFPAFPEFKLPTLEDFGWSWDWCWNSSDLKAFWEKGIDLQESAIDNSKDQFEKFFEQFQDAADSFADALPEELPWMPSWAKPPKEVRKAVKEWEKMLNDFIVEQANSGSDFAIQAQKKACEMIPEAPQSAEEKGEVIEAKAEVKSEAKDKPAAKAATKPAAKAAAKPAAKQAAKPAAKPAAKTAADAKDAKDAK